MAFILALTGVLLVFGVVVVLNSPALPEPVWTRVDCDSISPDGVYRCRLPLAHNGWCENGNLEWRYNSWAIAADDSTRAAAPPTEAMPATTEFHRARKRRLPRPLLWLGLGFLLWVATYSVGYTADKPDLTCDWSGVSCTNWRAK